MGGWSRCLLRALIVQIGHSDCKSQKGTSGRTCVLRVEPPKTVAQETDLVVARIKKRFGDKPLTPVLFTVSLMRSGGGRGPKTESFAVGKLSEFRGILKLLNA